MDDSGQSPRRSPRPVVVLRFAGRALVRIVEVVGVAFKAASGQANGYMEVPSRPPQRQSDYRP
jgi:hypothetical protein